MSDAMKEFEKKFEAKRARVAAIIKDAPATKPCDNHPKCTRPLDPDETFRNERVAYAECGECRSGKLLAAENRKLHAAGVPSNLLHATLDNWLPGDPTEESHLASVREFAKCKRGSLLLLGTVGTGKTHLAVGVMRAFKRPLIFKQNTLLRALRATYHDREAENPIPACQDADLLVLDEMGVTSGGRDEYPALHEILDHRYGEYLPTVITSNLGTQELRDMLGERLMDRIAQAAFKVLTFGGPSHRRQLRDQYRAGEQSKPTPEELWNESFN